MDQLDPNFVDRVNTKVSAVVERYLLDNQDVTPENTRKAYEPKQAEWMYQLGRALPGHLVDEGKLVLFLDEEIASRPYKCGKRRKAEAQRLHGQKRSKRQKPESISSSMRMEDHGRADVIVVGEDSVRSPMPERKLESELESDFNKVGVASTADSSTLKLRYTTVWLYSNAIINLYAQQKARGENPAPHPNGVTKKALIRYILREATSQSRREWTDRMLSSTKDSYSPSKILEHTAAAWRFSDVNSGFRTNVDFLFGNHMLLRSTNRLALELADCFCLELPKEGPKTSGERSSPTKVLVVLMNQGKTNQHGQVEYGSCLRHRDPEACLVGQLAFWLFFRWQAEKRAAEPFPDFSRPECWYQIKVLRRSKANYTGQLSYATAHKWTSDFYSMCGIKTSKATHAPRVTAAQNANMAGVSDAQIRRAGRWENGGQMTGCYITTLPFEYMRATADFEPTWAGSYHVPRATVQPEPWLRSQIWPQLDRWRDFEADDKATGAVIELLNWLRDVFLQDAFNSFAAKIRGAELESFKEDRDTAIEKVIPEVSEKLKSLTAYQLTVEKAVERRHLELLQEVKQLKAQIADMCPIEYKVVTTFTPDGMLHRTEQFARRQGHDPNVSTRPLSRPPRRGIATPLAGPPPTVTSSPTVLEGAPPMTVLQQSPPQIQFPRTLRSVGDLYQLWRHGSGTMPSVDELEKRWGSRWRLRSERQLFSMRKLVIDEVVKVAGARGWPEEDAVQEVERRRVEGGNLSLDAFAKQLKAARKA
ncbi:hypothetical protein VTI28DRAFT_1802 [Corynascus sepedonium]